MQLNITGHHIEVTSSLRAYTTEKMQRLSRHYDQIVSVDVILNVEKLEQIAEASVHVAGRTLFATDTSQDMYAAIDGLVDKLDKQVRRLKDKLRGHQHVKPQPLDPED